jgi:phosphodiesterase/alkaline phosphatase D-like protein
MLSAYVQAGAPDTLTIWVGLFNQDAKPAQPSVELNGAAVQPQVVAPVSEIRDGNGVNYRTILRLTGLTPDTPYDVAVVHGGERYELATATLPEAIPQMLDGAFNVLLCSCYSQPEDGSGLLATIVSQLKVKPHLTLMLGDQIYGDLPLDERLPDDLELTAQKIGAKYFDNWTSSQLGAAGLESILKRAPVVCVADDHEFWNNYPFAQTQLPKTWTEDGRKQWTTVAKALYEDYEIAGPAGGTQRLEIDPLSVLAVDMRSERDMGFGKLVTDATLQDMKRWADDLIAAKDAGTPKFGVLVSGQALFATPADESERVKVDAELGNYDQFDGDIMRLLDDLADHGIPVVYITGDVHWGRVARRFDFASQRPMLYEVIASPSRMIRTPGLDRAKEAAAGFGRLFGRSNPWPRHSAPPPVPDRWGRSRKYSLEFAPKSGAIYPQQGDQVAIISFVRAGGGVDFSVTYYGIHPDKALQKSVTTPTYQLRIT